MSALLRTLLFVGLLASCSPQKIERSQPPGSCSQIPLQSSEWTPDLTRQVFECLTTQVLGEEISSEDFENVKFVAISKLLNESFSTEGGRMKFLKLLETTRAIFPEIRNIVLDPETENVLLSDEIRTHIPWLIQNMELATPELARHPIETAKVGISIFELFQSKTSQLELLYPLSKLVKTAHKKEGSASFFLLQSRSILDSLAQHPDVTYVMNKLSKKHYCQSAPDIITESPFAQTIEFFKEDRLSPLNFLSSAEQGYAFWYQVCGSQTANTPNELGTVLAWVFQEWDPLQSVFHAGDEKSWLESGLRLIELDQSSHPKLLKLLFNSQLGKTAAYRLAEDSQMRHSWTEGLDLWIEGLENSQMELLPFMKSALLKMLASPIDSGAFMSQLSQLDSEVLAEVFEIFQIVSQKQWPAVKSSVETGKVLTLLDFFQWFIQGKEEIKDTNAPVYSDWEWRDSPPQRSENAQAKLARNLVLRCHKNSAQIKVIHDCFEQSGLNFSPKWIAPLWTLNADSAVLLAAHPDELEYVSSPALARPFWKELFEWFAISKIEPEDFLKTLSPINRIIQSQSQISWNDFLATHSQVLFEYAEPVNSPLFRNLSIYKKDRAQDIDTDLFTDGKVRQFLFKPQFWNRLIVEFLSHKKWEPSKQAIYRLINSSLELNLWVQDGRLAKLNINSIEALDLLLWELKIPIISSSTAIASVLNSWEKNKNADDVRSWLNSKHFQLSLAEKLASLKDDSGFGMRRRFENAIRLVNVLRQQPDQKLRDLLAASRFLELFKSNGRSFTSTSAKSLLFLHQMGLLQAANVAFNAKASWSKQILKSRSLDPKFSTLLNVFAQEIRAILESVSPASLRKLGKYQVNSEYWFLRSISATACSVFFTSPQHFNSLLSEKKLLTEFLKNASLVFRKYLEQNSDVLEVSFDKVHNVILAYPTSPPDENLLVLIDALSSERQLMPLWRDLYKLPNQSIEDLIVWLETGIPQRLMKWNRLMKPATGRNGF